jgi:hypothetical protein
MVVGVTQRETRVCYTALHVQHVEVHRDWMALASSVPLDEARPTPPHFLHQLETQKERALGGVVVWCEGKEVKPFSNS